MKKIQIHKQNYQFFKRKHCLKNLPEESDFPQQDSIYYTCLPQKNFFNGRKFRLQKSILHQKKTFVILTLKYSTF